MGTICSYHVELADNKLPFLVKEKGVTYPSSQFSNPKDIVNMMNTIYSLGRLGEEHIYIIAFTTKISVIGIFHVSQGDINSSSLNIQGIFTRLLLCNAAYFICLHNHPSGDVCPSYEDIETTKKLKNAGQLMGIPLLDHIIVAGNGYKSIETGGFNNE